MYESVRISFTAALPSAVSVGTAFELKLHLCSEAGEHTRCISITVSILLQQRFLLNQAEKQTATIRPPLLIIQNVGVRIQGFGSTNTQLSVTVHSCANYTAAGVARSIVAQPATITVDATGAAICSMSLAEHSNLSANVNHTVVYLRVKSKGDNAPVVLAAESLPIKVGLSDIVLYAGSY
jgi:hypothetical protein